MQKIHFSIFIHAPREKVWNTMLDDQTYRQWTSAFSEGGYYKGDWNKGSKIVFVGPDPETGKEGGMVSRIAENKLHEFISIEHIGIIVDGVEDTTSEEAKKWTPAYENYTFEDENGGTKLTIDVDVDDNHVDMFNKMWPPALEKLKTLSEAS